MGIIKKVENDWVLYLLRKLDGLSHVLFSFFHN